MESAVSTTLGIEVIPAIPAIAMAAGAPTAIAAMFVLMQSVWTSGYLQIAIEGSRFGLTLPAVIMELSMVASQILSNVP